MESGFLFSIKQQLKMVLQNLVLPCVYGFWKAVYSRKTPERIIFADAHHDSIPFSMQFAHAVILKRGYSVVDVFHNYADISQIKAALLAIKFMRLYAQAKYVFICDNFLPVASCRKRRETTVVQLWHATGELKKMGYDTTEDIPSHYMGNVYNNYDVVTVSAPRCVASFTGAMRQKAGIIQPLGISRTDCFFDKAWIETCKGEFYRQYPDAENKKIILWAPTFRGNAADPYQVGMEALDKLEQQLGEGYYLIRKLHPHVERIYHRSNCDIPAERILPVTDLLISDYSTIIYDFMFFHKPYVLFAPDLKEYEQKRGFYPDYRSLSAYLVTEETELKAGVEKALNDKNLEWIADLRNEYLESCDGKATDRILEYIGM